MQRRAMYANGGFPTNCEGTIAERAAAMYAAHARLTSASAQLQAAALI